MPINEKINLTDLANELTDCPTENLVQWRKPLTDNDAFADLCKNTINNCAAQDPALTASIMLPGGQALLMAQAIMVMSFELGRLYGRSELMQEMESKNA